MMKQDQVRFSQRALSALLSVLLATQPLLPAVAASITPSGNTQIDKAANGVPVVNIATPNQSGISHNKYNDYNVGKEGLILNNATGQLNQTQLGGLIQNNPNLKAGQEAKGIINEVTGTNRSNLQGYTEVAGKAANVIVANPYGITCNGCGFINTPNVTLTTGKPVLDASGKLQSLDVTQGAVTIEGAGLNGSQSDAVSIISRATEINAQLHAKDLRVVAGANRVAADGSVSALKGEGTAPKVAVDTGALGGMYANRIRLVSSETGVGVNLGNLNARQGDIALSSAGKVVLKDTLASGSTTVSAADVTLRGDHKAGGNVTVSGQTALTLDQAHVAADNNLQLTTRGTLTQNGGAFTAANDATLAATTLIQSADARASAGRHLVVNAEKNAALNGSVVAGQQLSVKGGELVQQGNLSASEIALNAQTLTQESRSTTNASGNIALTTSGHSQLKGSTAAGHSLAVSAGSLANHGALAAVADARINTGKFSNTGTVQGNSLTVSGTDITSSGTLKSASTLDIRARNATLSGETGAKGKTTVTASGNLNNSGALISDDTLTLNAAQIVNSGTLSGVRGVTTSAETFTASAKSVTHSDGDVALNNTDTTLAGETSAGGAVTVQGRSLNTTATAQTQGNSIGVAVQNANLEGTQAAKGNLTLKADSSLNHTGKSSASGLKVETGHFSNSGTLTASSLAIDSPEVINGGLIHAGQTLSLVSRLLDNRSSGVLYSPAALSLSLSELNNAGIITSDAALSLSGSNLTNSGELSGASLAIDYETLKNSAEGMLLAHGANRITAQSVSSAGSMVGNTLTLNADRLESAGLLQGDSALSLTAGILNLLTGSRTLTEGELGLSGTTLTTAGQLQGQDVSIRAFDWNNRGSSLATGSLDVTTAGTLSNTGELMSQGNGTLNAVNTVNSGNMLSAGDLSLNGKTLRNSGTLQGNRVTAHQDNITNSGTLTGIAALTLAARLEMAAPLLTLVNDASGSLLTAGELSVTGGDLRNAGQWQGRRVLIHAQALTNGGAIQAENLLDAQIDSILTGTTGSKITSNGELALSALTLANSGQWIAKHLTLGASTLNNSGEITGVDALSVALTQLNNQAGGKLLSAGALTLDVENATNAGQIQGKATTVTAGQLINSGRLQGEALTLNVSGALNNTASGVLLSENALTVSTATLNNQGTLQGGGESSVKATTRVQNDGKMLSGGKLTLTAPELENSSSGLVQAVRLLLDVVNAANSGRILATDNAELRGTTLTNDGMLQGADLLVNYQKLSNSGTALGTRSLTVKGDEITHSISGKLFSAGNLTLNSGTLKNAGQIVALGDVTLHLLNALEFSGTLAASNTLSLTAQGDITNNGTLQGNSLVLSTGGVLTNNGQFTAGKGDSTFSAQRIVLNAAGSLSAGGDVVFNSLSDITVNGFTGTAGRLTMNAVGTLLNTALIYAANNMQLFADRIHNVYGDILAGNSLWMQKNAAGAANSEVVNTSGNIETQKGDLTVATGLLSNKWEQLDVEVLPEQAVTSLPWVTMTEALIPAGWLPREEYDWFVTDFGGSGTGAPGFKPESWATPYEAYYEKAFAVLESEVRVNATGKAARIASGRDLFITAGELDNQASFILAQRDATLSGSVLNNQSWESGKRITYQVYHYDASETQGRLGSMKPNPAKTGDVHDTIRYLATGERYTATEGTATSYRAVIQAGGNIHATFTNDISNTLVTANTDGFSNTIAAPTLTPLSNQSITSGEQAQALVEADAQDITTPQWRDAVSDALKDISGGSSLSNQNGSSGNYPLPSGNNGYFVPSTDPDSPYLITVNPKLDDLGNMDDSLFNGLYDLLGITPGATPRETNSAYTDRNQFLGSSYFLDRLGLNPDRDYRFLGDAAFDTRYVSNAILNQTGSRYINGIGSDLDQMRYLMNSAAEHQKTLGLKFGVALTAEQVAALDKSMLWWESATINGQTVMIPKVYLSPKDVTVHSGSVISGNNVQLAGGNVINSGSTIAAQNGLSIDSSNSLSNLNAGLLSAGGGLNLSALGDINNIGSTISGKTVGLESVAGSINNITRAQQWNVDAGNVHFSGTDVGKTASITATDGLTMRAGQDINVTGANVSAGGSLGMAAGNDINITANEIATSEGRAGRNRATTETASVTHQGSTLSAGDDLTLQAGNDVNARAAAIAAEGDVGIQAGRDVNLLAEASMERSSSQAKKKTAIDESVRQQGTEIASGGNTVILAGRDVTAQAADVTAQGDIGVAAGRDVNLTTATESDYRYREQTKTSSGFLSKKTTHTIEEDSATREKGSLLSGDNVTVSAGNNLRVLGSAVAGDGDVALSAGNNVDIVAATNTDTAWRFKETKKSGLMGTGGIGFTIGSSKSTHDLREQGTTQSESFSTVGSTGGNVSIAAGKQAHIGGADIIAQKDISLTGDSVVIEPGHDKRTRDEKFEQKSSGLTVALSGAAGSAVNNAVTTAQSAKQSSDSRLAALQGTQAALSGVQAGQAVALDQVKGDSDKRNNNTIGVSASIGSQSSKSSSHMESETTTGSSLSAGNNVTIKATGSDITVAGSQIKAGKDVTLDAARDVNLIASQDTQQTTGKNSSSGGSLGVGVGVGSGGAGISISANANSSKGHEKGNGVWQNETTVDAGNRVTINTGRDATIAGAQVSGETVVADIGRDLTIASTQDSDHYNSKQNSVSGGAGYTFGAGGFSGSINVSRDKMTSDYDSVQEQSGLFAGSGGFDVTVGNHTQLDGGVIASTATADKNRLDTGTLGFSDIHNQADFKTEHQGAGISSGGSIGKQFAGNMANALLAGGGNSGHAEGTTQAAVSEGTLIIRDKENQKQDVADLSRDAEHANGSISPIFDKEKEQQRLQEVQLIGEIGSQAVDIANTYGETEGLKAARDALAKEGVTEPDADASDALKKAYQDALRGSDAYKTTTAKYGTGSDLQRGIQAATAALQGLAGSDLKAALAGASAPELAYRIGHGMGIDDNTAAKTIAHAILGGAVAALQGNNAAAGAAGAATGELAANAIAGMLYPGKAVIDLSEEQKQTVSALATISAGMAGGLAGNSTASAMAGGQAGKNSSENNLLGGNEDTQTKFVQEHGKNIASCSTDPGSASCQKGLAMNDALMVALPAGLGGGVLAAATPEIAAAAQAAIQACAGNVVLCLNSAGIQVSEAIVPGGVGAGGAVGIGKSVAEATAAKAEALAANAAKNLSSDIGKINAGKFGQLELNSLSKTGANIDSAAKSGNFTVAGRALQKHGSREGSAYPAAKGTPAQMNEQGQKILDEIVKAPGASVKEGNRFGGFDVIAPDGRGARFDPQGNFRGFLEP
ncbi:hemagglutinin repeat-containing protein [Enterobacter cloacae]|uniref:hemagglutinin repeat-containing protein n=1 Tax=Enterobacter cloacae TaxID=550 RepID=UPI001E2A8E65|nr:hemagglutinin repeat-containing protein [Enterobacter cloacae]MCE1968585.1 hemagglutinin repeat-containing protein [Enterobacter cloacae]